MSEATASIPSLASFYSRTTLATVHERPTDNMPATLPAVDLPTAVAPSGPVLAAPSIMSTMSLRSEVAPTADVSRPATLPVVDWTFVAATPEPPRRHHGASLVQSVDPPARPDPACV